MQGLPGASFASALGVTGIDYVVQKGTDGRSDSYSAFYDNGRRQAAGLSAHLRCHGIDTVFVVSLAPDVCLKFTVLGALAEGFATTLVTDGTKGVDMEPGDTEAVITAMRNAGAPMIDSETLIIARK